VKGVTLYLYFFYRNVLQPVACQNQCFPPRTGMDNASGCDLIVTARRPDNAALSIIPDLGI